MYLPIFTLAQHHLEPGFVPLVTQHAHFGRARRTAIDEDTLLPLENIAGAHLTRYLGDVDLG